MLSWNPRNELVISQTSVCTKRELGNKYDRVYASSSRKVCDEREERKNYDHVKFIWWKEALYKAVSKEWQTQFWWTFEILTIKVLILE